jgi:predicted phosphohydrolase
LPHRHKVLIAGNHDWAFAREPARARALLGAIRYLQDDAVTLDGVRFWGSPWQPEFCGWAFNLPRGPMLAARWARIPADTDVLVTHCPPHRIADRTFDGCHAGCEALRARVAELGLSCHVFGHIHEGYGTERHAGTIFVNASSCDLGYRPTNPPVVLDLPASPRRAAGR